MDQEKDTSLMESWEHALVAYGTPKEYAQGTTLQTIESNIHNTPHITLFTTQGYSMRKELMEKLKVERDTRKHRPPRWKNDGDECFLCDNIGQAKDTGANILLPYEMFPQHVVMPNRFPLVEGHILICSKEHNPPGIFEQWSKQYLCTMMDIAHTYGYAITRNHGYAGMSIPEHEHAHGLPLIQKDLEGRSIDLTGITEQKVDHFLSNGIGLLESRYETVVIEGMDSIDKMYGLVKNLVDDNIIFTSALFPIGKGKFYVRPHAHKDGSQEDDQSMLGAAKLMHHFIQKDDRGMTSEKFHDTLDSYLYRSGTFPWEEYIVE